MEKETALSEDSLKNTVDNDTKGEAKDRRVLDAEGNTAGQSLLPVILSTIAILLAGGLLAVYFFSGQQQAKRITDFAKLQQQLSAADGELETLQQTVASLQQQQSTQTTQIQDYARRVQTIYQDNAYLKQDWVLDETAYLLRLANLNLHWLYDSEAAITLLQAVDATLTELDDPILSPLRDTLAQDIADLRAIPALDLVGIVTQLNALGEQIPKLPLIAATEETLSDSEALAEEGKAWRRTLARNLQKLQKLVVIRYHNQPVKPLLPPAQRVYLDQNLSLALQQARWAAVQRQQTLYQMNIEQAIVWIKDYFDTNSVATKSILDSLTQLSTRDVSPQLPVLNEAIQQLQSIMQAKQSNTEALP